MNAAIYRENRARFSVAELRKYHGQWVAFSEDGCRIVASNADLAALDQLIRACGEDPQKVALEQVEFDDVFLGAAELS